MGLFTTPIKTLDDLFLHTIEDMYYAEHQIAKALPKMIEKARTPELHDGLSHHLQETREHIERLDQVFRHLDRKAEGVTCDAIRGIIAEAEQVMSDIADQRVLEAGIATSAQAVEHYEISRYGSLIALARQLGHTECIPLLEKTLEEEKAADAKLTRVAESQVNRQAA